MRGGCLSRLAWMATLNMKKMAEHQARKAIAMYALLNASIIGDVEFSLSSGCLESGWAF